MVPAVEVPYINGERLFDYFLVSLPAAEHQEKLMREKFAFYDSYQPGKFMRSKAHLTLSQFKARNEMEDTMIRWLQRIVGEQKSFSLMLNNYSGFPAHTVYLRVQDPHPLKTFTTALEPINYYVSSNGCPPVQFVNHPHVSIASNLPQNVYDKAILDYSKRLYHEPFLVSELQLLRREPGFETCRTLARFELQPAAS